MPHAPVDREQPLSAMVAVDPFSLERFVLAQQRNYAEAVAELRAGRKRMHWSWYVFPQVSGLGSSGMSVRYAISGVPEAVAYLAHPVLGARLIECVCAMNQHSARSAEEILGTVDALKFHACVTLFAQASAPDSVFKRAIAIHFSGRQHAATQELLAAMGYVR